MIKMALYFQYSQLGKPVKKTNAVLALPLLFLALSSSVAIAEPIKSGQEISGNWLLEYTKKSETAEETNPMGMTWAFTDNQLIVKDIPQVRGGSYDASPVSYIIDNGNLKVNILGRANKFDIYTLVKKIDNTMILKDTKHGSYLYFKKK